MKRTGVFASEDEKKAIVEAVQQARSTPVIALSMSHGFDGGFSGDAWQFVKDIINKTAEAHGLPTIPGDYGFDPETGEFLAV